MDNLWAILKFEGLFYYYTLLNAWRNTKEIQIDKTVNRRKAF